MENEKTIIMGTLILLLATSTVSAAQVGVYVDDGKGNVKTECKTFEKGETTYDILSKDSDFKIYDFGWGYGVCAIHDIGCEATNDCFNCNPPMYWSFWTKKGSTWVTSPVGIGEHKPVDGEIIGFKYDDWNILPPIPPADVEYKNICAEEDIKRGKHVHIPRIIAYAVLPATPTPGDNIRLELKDNITGRPVKGAVVEVFDGLVGVTTPVHSIKSNQTGELGFNLNRVGEYTLTVTGTKYPHEYIKIKVADTTTTTTDTTTTTTTASTTTTTTYKPPPHFLYGASTTTTTQTTSTTNQTPKVTGAATAQEKQTEDVSLSLLDWLAKILGL